MPSPSSSSRSTTDQRVLTADLQLLIASMSFGFGFAGQKEGMVEGCGPLTFNALRYMISTIILAVATLVVPWITGSTSGSSSSKALHDKDDDSSLGDLISKSLSASLDKEAANTVVVSSSSASKSGSKSTEQSQRDFNAAMSVWFYGFALAFFNFSGSTLQQMGIQYTSSSESAFLTGFYIVFTPLLQVLIPSISSGPKPKWNTWLAVSLAMLGLFIISESQSSSEKTELDVSVNNNTTSDFKFLSLGYGEILTLVGAFFWTFHILLTDYATDRVDTLQLTLVQLLGTSLLAFLASYNFEFGEWNSIHVLLSWKILLFMGAIECCGFTFGALGQSYAPPHHAAVIYGSEVVWATIGGVFVVHELCSVSDVCGCVLMLMSTGCAKIDKLDWGALSPATFDWNSFSMSLSMMWASMGCPWWLCRPSRASKALSV